MSDSTNVAVQVVDEVSEKLEMLAEALKVPAEHVYAVLVKQAQISGFRAAGCAAAAAVYLLFFGLYLLPRMVRDLKAAMSKRVGYGAHQDEGLPVVVIICSSVFAIVALISMIVNGYDCIGLILNPEYYAIREILDVLK